MKRILSFLLTMITLFSLVACGNTEPTPTQEPEPAPEQLPFNDNPEAITAASSSVVMLFVYDSSNELFATGSGFPIIEDGIIVTNYHVINGADHITANTETELFFNIDEIVAVDVERDIAILRTNAKVGFELLPIGNSEALMKGEKVVAIGSPLGLINTVSEGMFSNIRAEGTCDYLQFTAAISPGSSGGALFNNKGEVIGITSASYVEGQNLNLAIPIEDVLDVWEHQEDYSLKSEYESGDESENAILSVDEFLSNWEDYVGKEVIVAGYLSSFWCIDYVNNKYKTAPMCEIYITSNKEDVKGIHYQRERTAELKEYPDEWIAETSKVRHLKKIGVYLKDTAVDEFRALEPGCFIVFKCTCKESTDYSYRYPYPLDFELLDVINE